MVSGEKTLVAVMAGQSNIANYGVTPYTPTHISKIDNISFLDGGCYQGKDPALGATGHDGSWLFRFADKLISEGTFDRVMLIPVAVGGSTIEEWAPNGVLQNHLRVACRRAAAHGLLVNAILWQQGESSHHLTSSQYQLNFAAMRAQVLADGFDPNWFVGKSTWMPAGVGASSAIRDACGALVDGVKVFAGADTDDLSSSTYRQFGGSSPHFTDTASDIVADRWVDAIQAFAW